MHSPCAIDRKLIIKTEQALGHSKPGKQVLISAGVIRTMAWNLFSLIFSTGSAAKSNLLGGLVEVVLQNDSLAHRVVLRRVIYER